jgi:hypothetical protein
MKYKRFYVLVIYLFLCFKGFALGESETSKISYSSYLFQEYISKNYIAEIEYLGGYGESYYYVSNIGFTLGKRIIYNGDLQLLNTYIPDSALAVLTKDELRLFRNTIYAKYGMIFQSNDLKLHFQRFNWYNPRYNNVESQLSENDKQNIKKIQVFENSVPNYDLNKKNLVGFWASPTDAWKGNEIAINSNDTIIADLQEENRSFNWNWKGNYRIENGFLVVLVIEQYIGTPNFIKNNNWHWPDGITYSRGIISYKEPIRLVFPIIRLGWEDENILKIGSIEYNFFKNNIYHEWF